MSGFIVSLLTGLAVLLAAVLNLVPKAVLLGIFLYMGVSATAGIHLLERAILMLMPVKHHPNVPYVKKVSTVLHVLLSRHQPLFRHLRNIANSFLTRQKLTPFLPSNDFLYIFNTFQCF